MLKFALSFFIATASFAGVGDYTLHEGQYGGNVGAMESKVTGFDAVKEIYTVQTVIRIAGSTETYSEITPKDALFTPAMAAEVLSACSQIGGVRESVLGHNTCKLRSESLKSMNLNTSSFDHLQDGVVWIGNIPISGIVKLEADAGFNMTIKDYGYSN